MFFSERLKTNRGIQRTKHVKIKTLKLMCTNFGSMCSSPELLTELHLICKSYTETAWNFLYSNESDQCVSHHFITKLWLQEQPSTAWYIHKNTLWMSMCSKNWYWLSKICVFKGNSWIWVLRAPRRGVLRPQIWYLNVTQKASFRQGGFHSPVPCSAVNRFGKL